MGQYNTISAREWGSKRLEIDETRVEVDLKKVTHNNKT
jgi:hypothetical protein